MWQIDCAIGAAKSVVPFQDQLRAAKHRVRAPRLHAGHDLVIQGALGHAEALTKSGTPLAGKEVLEIGSGWFPILPIVLRLAGARRVYLTDAYRLLTIRTLQLALDHVQARREPIAAGLGLEAHDVERFVQQARGLALDPALARLGLTYIAPFETSRGMPPVDVVISHTVLEHIPPETIRTIFSDVGRGLREGGVMIHGVDNTDHRSHKDPRLGPFDFLRYGDGVWRWLCLHPQDYTNRLRHSDYLQMAQACGFEVLYEHRHLDASLMRHVESLPLAERFRDRPVEDLATSWTQFVARPRRAGY